MGARPIPWYPHSLAWSTPCDKRTLRKLPQLRALQKWLVTHSDTGDVWRQEAVSMIPALLLDINKSHFVRLPAAVTTHVYHHE